MELYKDLTAGDSDQLHPKHDPADPTLITHSFIRKDYWHLLRWNFFSRDTPRITDALVIIGFSSVCIVVFDFQPSYANCDRFISSPPRGKKKKKKVC